jgi:hypothetical protein
MNRYGQSIGVQLGAPAEAKGPMCPCAAAPPWSGRGGLSRRGASAQQLHQRSRAFVSEAGRARAVEQRGDRVRHLSIELRFVGMTNNEVYAARADFERGVVRSVVFGLDFGRISR